MPDSAAHSPIWPARIRAWMERRGTLLAFVWGVAEATVFFLVPDVAIVGIALFGRRLGLRAAAAALAGALLGGTLLYGVAGQMGPDILPRFDKIPAISATMIETVDAELDRMGTKAVGVGPLTGKPYKLYAANSGVHHRGFWSFLLWTIPARGLRFFPAALITAALASFARRRGVGDRGLLLTYFAFWISLYIAYISLVGI